MENIVQKIIAAFLSFLLGLLSLFNLNPTRETVWGREDTIADGEVEALPLPEGITLYCAAVPEEEIASLPDSDVRYASRDLLLQMEGEVAEEEAQELAWAYGAELVGFIDLTGTCQWRFTEEMGYDELVAVLEELGEREEVACASLNYIVDRAAVEPEGLESGRRIIAEKNKAVWGAEQSHVGFAWEHREWLKEPVSVAVLDFGFQQHPKLHYAQLRQGNDVDPNHGTHVMGIIGAEPGRKDVRGVYPEASGHMYAYDISGCSDMELFVSIVDAIARGTKVLNLSIGRDEEATFNAYMDYRQSATDLSSSAFQIYDSGMHQGARLLSGLLKRLIDEDYEFLLVYSAGNVSSRAEDWEHSCFFKKDEPGYRSTTKPFKKYELTMYDRYSLRRGRSITGLTFQVVPPEFSNPVFSISDEAVAKRILCVSAYGQDRRMAGYADMGERVDLLAPGTGIYSTCKGGVYPKDGTSMAAPFVTGALACIWSMDPSQPAETIREILLDSCTEVIRDTGSPYQKPVLNVENAMRYMRFYLDPDSAPVEPLPDLRWWEHDDPREEGDQSRDGSPQEGDSPKKDYKKSPVKIIVREKGSGKAIEAPQMEIRDAAGQIQMFPQPSSGKTDPAEASKDFFAYATEDAWHDMDEYFCYLDPGIYQVIVLADGYETAVFDGQVVAEDGGVQTWTFDLYPASGALEDALQDYLRDAILARYPVLSTETLYGLAASGWTERDLDGCLSADVQDYDHDGMPELLAVRVGTVRTEMDGAALEVMHYRLDTSFYLEMYEYDPSKAQVILADTKELPVYIGYLPWGVPLTQTGIFRYDHQGTTYLAVDSYLAMGSEEITTLDLFAYDGERFIFEQGYGYQELQGDIYVKEALEEPQSLTYCGYSAMRAEGSGWDVLQAYDLSSHSYKSLTREEEQPFMAAYEERLVGVGIYTKDTRLQVNQEIQADKRYLTVTTPDVYTGAEGEIHFISGIYTIYGSGGSTALWRKDYAGSLDGYR
ncbi:MAG: S8 family serine peptidase [Lachnospiraceae bacterium]|nr:S8 family serine peptidase [Lachnospiraceae bacterium]